MRLRKHAIHRSRALSLRWSPVSLDLALVPSLPFIDHDTWWEIWWNSSPIDIPSFTLLIQVRFYVYRHILYLCICAGVDSFLTHLGLCLSSCRSPPSTSRLCCSVATQWLSNHAASTTMSYCSLQWSQLYWWRHKSISTRLYLGLGWDTSLSIVAGCDRGDNWNSRGGWSYQCATTRPDHHCMCRDWIWNCRHDCHMESVSNRTSKGTLLWFLFWFYSRPSSPSSTDLFIGRHHVCVCVFFWCLGDAYGTSHRLFSHVRVSPFRYDTIYVWAWLYSQTQTGIASNRCANGTFPSSWR